MDNKRYLSWSHMTGLVTEIIRQMAIDAWRPELVVGITRGGALPAVMISQFYGVKMIGLDVSLRDHTSIGPESNCWAAEMAMEGKKILIVDDINDTGETLNWVMNDWDSSGASQIAWNDVVRFATVVDNESSKFDHVDYAGLVINKANKDEWIVFPYEEWWKS